MASLRDSDPRYVAAYRLLERLAVGLLALWGAFDPRLRRAGLAALAFTCSGLGLIRLASALLAGEFSTYTKQGLGLEIPLFTIAIWLLVRDLRGHP